MQMVKVKIADLVGAQLDWAVAKAGGLPLCSEAMQSGFIMAGTGEGDLYTYAPSTDWRAGGPIIEHERIDLWHRVEEAAGNDWHATCAVPFARFGKAGFEETEEGPTPLVAAMRAFVAAKLGDEVEVPEVPQ